MSRQRMLLRPKLSKPDQQRPCVPHGTSAIFFQMPLCFIPQTPISQVIAVRTTQVSAEIKERHTRSGMNRYGRDGPSQALRKYKTDVTPRAHVAHHRHPAQPFKEKLTQGVKISDRFNGIGQELHFKTLLRNQTADQQIVRGTILDRGVATESGEMFSRGDNGLSKGELDSVQLTGHQDAG